MQLLQQKTGFLSGRKRGWMTFVGVRDVVSIFVAANEDQKKRERLKQFGVFAVDKRAE